MLLASWMHAGDTIVAHETNETRSTHSFLASFGDDGDEANDDDGKRLVVPKHLLRFVARCAIRRPLRRLNRFFRWRRWAPWRH